MNSRTAATMDAIVQEAIREGQIPGAVVVVGHKGSVVFQKAYGNRALVPQREPMTLDTIFDVASLTKVVATTSAIAKLVEEGKIRLNEKVTELSPEFQGGKSDITVQNLLTHFSGMRPDVDLEPAWSGYEHGNPTWRQWTVRSDLPNSRFVYSDINFVLLGEIVQRVSGKTLPDYVQAKDLRAARNVRDDVSAAASLDRRIAPTEMLKGATQPPLRGIVHDPTARVYGRGRGTCRIVFDCGGFVEVRRDAARDGSAERRSHFQPVDGAEIYDSARSRRPADSARARMGYRLAVFG